MKEGIATVEEGKGPGRISVCISFLLLLEQSTIKLSGVKQHRFTVSWLWRTKTYNQGVGRSVVFLGLVAPSSSESVDEPLEISLPLTFVSDSDPPASVL